MLALSGATQSDGEAWTEHACLTVKSETAARVGLRAWSLLKGDTAERARPLGGRIHRHAYEAEAALERGGAMLLRVGLDRGHEVPDDPTAVTYQRARILRRIIRRNPAAATAVLIAAGVAAIIVGGPLWFTANDDSLPPRQGTLAGNEAGPTSSVPTSVAEATPTASPASTIVTLDFDRERMGEGLGEDWVQTAGGVDAVVLAPFPTAVNRSARLESVDAAGAEACRSAADTTVAVSGLIVDVLVSDPSTTALIIGRNTAGSAAWQVSLGTSGSWLAAGTALLARADGPSAGTWVRSEITALGEQTLWRVTSATSGAVTEQTIDVAALADVEQVCLAVTANSTGAAHFDNLTLATIEEG